MREILCHKLSQRQRKDLDDISERTGYRHRVKSCRRQFDNLKRIIRTVEEMKGPIIKNIIENFFLPEKMAEYEFKLDLKKYISNFFLFVEGSIQRSFF